jgi:hypothetical protein
MELSSRLSQLLSLAEELDIDVRVASMGGEGGGLCVLKGQHVLFVDLTADLATRYERTLTSMADLPELENRFLPPEIRQDLEKARSGR